MTPVTRVTSSVGKRRLKRTTATVQPAISVVHNRNEPSCEPQAAVNRYSTGRCRDE